MTTATATATVRFHAAPPPVRAMFHALERIAPAAGARWAEHIWFTLPRPDAPVNHGTFELDVGGSTVVGDEWGDGPIVYLMHGWAGRRDHLGAFVAPLVARGHRVIAFDAPSHGASGAGAYGPRSSSVPEFASALRTVVGAKGPAHAIIAHSMGANAAAVAVCDGLRADRIALLAPMASAASYARRLVRALGAGPRVHDRLVDRVERRLAAPLGRFDVPELVRAIALPPALTVHDRDDTSIPVSDGRAIATAWSGSRLRLTSGLGHRRLLKDPDVVADVVDFVSARI